MRLSVGDDALSRAHGFIVVRSDGAKLQILIEFTPMKAIELIKFSAKTMKALSEIGIRMTDCHYTELWREYCALVNESGKKAYAEAVVSSKYGVSVRTVKRIIKRFSADVLCDNI